MSLELLQPRDGRFAVAIPAKLIVINFLAFPAKFIFDRFEEAISGLKTFQGKLPSFWSDCGCHCENTIWQFADHAHRILTL